MLKNNAVRIERQMPVSVSKIRPDREEILIGAMQAVSVSAFFAFCFSGFFV